MYIPRSLLLAVLAITAFSLSVWASLPAGAQSPAAQASAPALLSGTPEPTEEPTMPPSDAIVAAAAVGPEWAAFAKIVEGANDFIVTVQAHEDNGTTQISKTFKLTSRKPNFARCEIVAGDGTGGVAVWRGGDKVQAHEGGEHKDIIVVLPRHNKRVTDLLGYGCGDTTPDRIVGYTQRNGKLTEAAGPTIGGVATDDVTWIPNPGDMGKSTKSDFLISKTTHLIVATKSYYGDKIVEDSTWNIQVDPGVKYSAFDIGG